MTQEIDVRREATEWVAKIEDAVSRGAETAENVHKSLVDLPFEMLARSGASEEKALREVTDRSVGAIYDLVRNINQSVSSLARDLIEGPMTDRPAE